MHFFTENFLGLIRKNYIFILYLMYSSLPDLDHAKSSKTDNLNISMNKYEDYAA